jgi:hypothetical protein
VAYSRQVDLSCAAYSLANGGACCEKCFVVMRSRRSVKPSSHFLKSKKPFEIDFPMPSRRLGIIDNLTITSGINLPIIIKINLNCLHI